MQCVLIIYCFICKVSYIIYCFICNVCGNLRYNTQSAFILQVRRSDTVLNRGWGNLGNEKVIAPRVQLRVFCNPFIVSLVNEITHKTLRLS